MSDLIPYMFRHFLLKQDLNLPKNIEIDIKRGNKGLETKDKNLLKEFPGGIIKIKRNKIGNLAIAHIKFITHKYLQYRHMWE